MFFLLSNRFASPPGRKRSFIFLRHKFLLSRDRRQGHEWTRGRVQPPSNMWFKQRVHTNLFFPCLGMVNVCRLSAHASTFWPMLSDCLRSMVRGADRKHRAISWKTYISFLDWFFWFHMHEFFVIAGPSLRCVWIRRALTNRRVRYSAVNYDCIPLFLPVFLTCMPKR